MTVVNLHFLGVQVPTTNLVHQGEDFMLQMIDMAMMNKSADDDGTRKEDEVHTYNLTSKNKWVGCFQT